MAGKVSIEIESFREDIGVWGGDDIFAWFYLKYPNREEEKFRTFFSFEDLVPRFNINEGKNEFLIILPQWEIRGSINNELLNLSLEYFNERKWTIEVDFKEFMEYLWNFIDDIRLKVEKCVEQSQKNGKGPYYQKSLLEKINLGKKQYQKILNG